MFLWVRLEHISCHLIWPCHGHLKDTMERGQGLRPCRSLLTDLQSEAENPSSASPNPFVSQPINGKSDQEMDPKKGANYLPAMQIDPKKIQKWPKLPASKCVFLLTVRQALSCQKFKVLPKVNSGGAVSQAHILTYHWPVWQVQVRAGIFYKRLLQDNKWPTTHLSNSKVSLSVRSLLFIST